MKAIANVISIASHPIFMAYFGMLIILNLHFITAAKIQGGAYWTIHLIFLAAMVVLPMLGMMVTFRKYKSKDWEGLNAKERRELGMVMAIMYGMITWSLSALLVHDVMKFYLMSLTIGTALIAVLQKWQRISYHAFAAAGLLPLILFISISTHTDLIYWFCGMAVLAGVICATRLYKNAHTLKQIHWGLALGLGINSIIFTYFYVVQ